MRQWRRGAGSGGGGGGGGGVRRPSVGASSDTGGDRRAPGSDGGALGEWLLPVTIGSVVSTLLVSLAVLAAAFCVLGIALKDPDQPATTRPGTVRGRIRSRRAEERPPERSAAPSPTDPPERPGGEHPAGVAAGPVAAAPPAATGQPRRRGARRRAELRIRSALTLVVLVTFVGVLLALAIGTALMLAAQALRDAVG